MGEVHIYQWKSAYQLSGDVRYALTLKKEIQIKLTRTISSIYAPQCGKNVVACEKVNRESVCGTLN